MSPLPVAQFLRYALCGVLATLVHSASVWLLSQTLFPAGEGMQWQGTLIGKELRAKHLLLNNALAWPLATWVAYRLNTALVFAPGRHGPWAERLLFTAVAALGFFPGGFVAHWLVQRWQLPSTVAQAGFIATSVAVNFLCRKFLIFRH